jgi:hypothetical protein
MTQLINPQPARGLAIDLLVGRSDEIPQDVQLHTSLPYLRTASASFDS